MIVVYNADERFAEVFTTSVVSLFENNKDADELTVYLIEDHISDESKEKLFRLAERYNRTIITLPMPELEKLAGVDVEIPQYNRMATCGRLFIASLLPQNIEKVIYVDCDTLFLKSIAELWEMDISKYAVGMADCAQNPSFRAQLGLKKNGRYYNSGLMLVNLKRWRQMNAEHRFIEFIQSQGGYIPFPDEGVLNAVFDGEIFCIPLRFNAQTMIFAFPYKKMCYARGVKSFYTPEEVRNARENPAMVHFTSNFYYPERPWVKGCRHPYAETYLAYRNLTTWKDKPLWEDARSLIRKRYTEFCRSVPLGVTVWTAHVISLYLMPLKHKYKKRRAIDMMKKNLSRGGYAGKITELLTYADNLIYLQSAYAAERSVA